MFFSNLSIFFIILYILIPYLVCNSTLRRRTQSIFSDVPDKVVSLVRTDVSARRQSWTRWKVTFSRFSWGRTAVFALFMPLGRDYVSELRHATGLLFTPRWFTSVKSHGGIILTGKIEKDRERPASLSTTKPTWSDRGANYGLRGERPATNSLRHGTVR
jgi:hypothetical protein